MKVRERIDQTGCSETYQYDAEGNLMLHIDRDGRQVYRTFNVFGDLVYEKATDADGNHPNITTCQYDSLGRLVRAVCDGHSYEYSYNKQGFLKEKRSSGKRLISYEYNSIGQLAGMKDPAGVTTHYEYDLLGRTSRISSDQGMEVKYAYDCLDRVEKIIYGNGVETSYQYDTYGNLSSLSTRTGETNLLSFTYAYDGNGNRIVKTGIQSSLTNGSNALDISYQYNIRGQLLEERRNGASVCYAYDAAGNRIRKTDAQGETVYQYNQKNQLLLKKGTKGIKKFTYDAQGGILEEKSTTGEARRFAYNSKHQQTKVETEDGHVQENRYDAEGLRFELLENGKRTRFVYHQGELLHEEGGDESQSSYHLGTGIESFHRSRENYYYHRDEQRSTVLIMGSNGRIQNSYQYDAFGVELEGSEQLSNRIRYTGQQYDSLTEQYYLRARYYNPVLGRFMQEDVYQGDGLNLYAYCNNNPVMYSDPSGYGKNNPQQNPYANVKTDGDGSQGDSAPLDDIISIMKDGTLTPDGRNIITQLDDGTKVIFRMDVGQYAHSIDGHGYHDPVDHISIEIQTKGPRGNYKTKWDFHIILDGAGEVVNSFATGIWTKK